MEMNEGSSKTLFDNIRKFNGSMDLNDIGVLRHKGKTLEKDCYKAARFQRIFFDGAHLLVNYLTTLFMKKNKSRSEREVDSHLCGILQGVGQYDLNMRITMDELKQAIKKVKTNNQGVDPYGLHPKLIKKFEFITISICLHFVNSAFFLGIWPFDKTIVKFLKKSGKTDYSNPSSWSPISLTSHLGKVVERVIEN